MSEPLVVAQGLSKTFRSRRGPVHAAADVSFECHAGEIFGLLGPNGAGKTTTLRMLATILTPTAGRASLAGFDVASQPGSVRENIGFLATETGLYDRFTARETLRFFGRINQLSDADIRTRTDEIFDTLNMSELAERRVGNFSTGEKQKLSLARSILHDPPVLILDEPTFGLDVMSARTVVRTIDLFREQGRTILLSTHIMRIAEKLCDRIGIMYKGTLHAIGTVAELKDQFGGEDLEEAFFNAVGNDE
ncbi:MAG: ATP-binding cassette domain-containing protein [Candidatus Atribacteria bacterium]|nr:MAG: ATP-binding cassette domain-containing protein [Candidatus Atribacteria bacterium]